MRAETKNQVLYIHPDDVPPYKKKGSMVRNTYFWALRSIADRSNLGRAWEFEEGVWLALVRMLTSFAESGYLAYRETILEFPPEAVIPSAIKPISTWCELNQGDAGLLEK
ncbi:MAG: hypothetical protein QNJ46_14845 [Leptolyngbyaceae cyanobacterium MO_188.B28]|nr:hypothetical protein [Leptolyngbyaceae cyanobacterium MO_188.B28]